MCVLFWFLFTDSLVFAFVVLVAPNSCQVWQHQATPSRSGQIGWRGCLTCMRFSRQCCIAQIFLPINASYGYQSYNESVLLKRHLSPIKNTIFIIHSVLGIKHTTFLLTVQSTNFWDNSLNSLNSFWWIKIGYILVFKPSYVLDRSTVK